MTGMNGNSEPAARWLVSEWLSCLTQMLEQKTGTPSRIERVDPAAEPAGELIWWAQEFGLRERPAVWVGVSEVDCRDLMRCSGADSDDWKSYGVFLADAFVQLAQSVSARSNADVYCGSGEQVSFAPQAATSLAADIVLAHGTTLRIVVRVDQELTDLAGAWIRTDETRGGDARAQSSGISETLELLLDLELPVSVSFGKIQLPFQDVLKLATGSIIELNRSVDDPVDIIVNEQVIASGEVVVVNGNYGVRIQRIASRSERMRSADAALLARGIETGPVGSRMVQ